ncbi:hypothetical protein PWT90_03198 [Aphanocladium album]|nr:hypothetical protein PWT90_03198 [Aphanocladium album]
MNALLASIFSPLKETTSSRNGQALDRLEDIASPTKKRGPRRSLKRKSVSFDMTPRKQIKYTPPKPGRTPNARERRELPDTRKRKAVEVLEDSRNVEEPASASANEHRESAEPEEAELKAAEVGLAEPAEPGAGPAEAEPEPQPEPEPEPAEINEPRPANSREFRFKTFVDHRWDGDSIQIQVEWADGQRTWEPETTLHHDARPTLLRYWAQQPGGRPDNPREPGLYEILAVRKHSRDRKRLFVEWVGYGPKDNTWEPCDVVQDAAPEILSNYWDSLPRTKRRRMQ